MSIFQSLASNFFLKQINGLSRLSQHRTNNINFPGESNQFSYLKGN